MDKKYYALILVVSLLVFISVSSYLYIRYENLDADYNDLLGKYNKLTNNYNDLAKNHSELETTLFGPAQTNYTAVTVVYYTNFGTKQQIMNLSIAYETYEAYHKRLHPDWGIQNLTSATEYITYNDTTINQIVETIKNQTQGKEELANAMLNFVQYKNIALTIRYYPTTELKYPIETLVEMGGDSNAHAFLYATLMRAAGFDVLLLLSKQPVSDGLMHAATAIHLTNPPAQSLPEYEDKALTYDGKEYYFAETTSWNYRVGDYPPWLENADFYTIPT
jgi:hypothetical protein